MKKLLALLLALALMLTFVACGNDKDDDDDKDDSKPTTSDSGDKDTDKDDDKDTDKDEDKDSNTFQTPIDVTVEYLNKKTAYDLLDAYRAQLNGFCEDEADDLFAFMEKVSVFSSMMEEGEELLKEEIADKKAEYGDDYKYSYKVLEKEAFDADTLEEWNDDLKDLVDAYDAIIASSKEAPDEDWEEAMTELGLDSVDEVKELFEVMEDISKAFKKAEITEGYTVVIETSVTGSELDEPEIDEQEVEVFKIDGRWIMPNAISIFASITNIG